MIFFKNLKFKRIEFQSFSNFDIYISILINIINIHFIYQIIESLIFINIELCSS